jgi:hypothetical protein
MSGLDKLKAVDWRGLVKSATNKVKQYALNLSPLELMVEDATNLETWGPHGSVMNGGRPPSGPLVARTLTAPPARLFTPAWTSCFADIAEACNDPEGYRQVLGVLARRLQERVSRRQVHTQRLRRPQDAARAEP